MALKRSAKKAAQRRTPTRKAAEISERAVRALAKLHASYAEIGDAFAVSSDTIEQRFGAIVEQERSLTKIKLRKKQLDLAFAGRGEKTMLIWLGKQFLGQADQQNVRVGDLEKMSDAELEQLARGQVVRS